MGKTEAVCALQRGEGELCSQLSLFPVLTLRTYRRGTRNRVCISPWGHGDHPWMIFRGYLEPMVLQPFKATNSSCPSALYGVAELQLWKLGFKLRTECRAQWGGSTNTESSCGSLRSSHQSSAQHREVLNKPLCSQRQLLGTVKRVAVSSGLQEMHVQRQTAKGPCYN